MPKKIYRIDKTFYGDYAVYVDPNTSKVRNSLAGGASWIFLNVCRTFKEAEDFINKEKARQAFKPQTWIYD